MWNVYLISCGKDSDRKYKIGITKRKVEDRIKQFQTGNSERFEILGVYQSKWGSKIESILHRNYQHLRIAGEWFNLSENQVDGFLNQCRQTESFLEDWMVNSTFKNPKTILK